MSEPPAPPRSQAGFTLIEILVALAVFASSAVLLARALTATGAGSARIFRRGLLESAAISKIDDLLAGTEQRSGGELESLAGATWRVRRSPLAGTTGLEVMERVDLFIDDASLGGGRTIHLWALVPQGGGR